MSRQKDLMSSVIKEMSITELEYFHASGIVPGSVFIGRYHRAKKTTLSNPDDQVTDEETMKSQFALPDKLVAKVLSYLPLRDRFRLETVCQQWKRCMYLEMEHLYVTFQPLGYRTYAVLISTGNRDCEIITGAWRKEPTAVLQKFRTSKVSHLTCYIQDAISIKELCFLLADIASKATEVVVTYDLHRPYNFITLCDIIGPHVTTFKLHVRQRWGFPQDLLAFAYSLTRMKQLKDLSCDWQDLIFTFLNCIPTSSLPHFRQIDLWFGSKSDWKLWENFKSRYGAQIKKISFPDGHWPDYVGKIFLPWKDLTSFANLEHLDIRFWLSDCTWTALKGLEATSRSCPLLKSFSLRLALKNEDYVVSLIEVWALFIAIGRMKMLEKLDLNLEFRLKDLADIFSTENLDLFALLENKSNITHLKADVLLYQISSQNKPIQPGIYSCLNSAMPKLRYLDIRCMASELDHFVGLQRMQSFRLSSFHSEESCESIQDSLIRILKSSPALRNFEFHHKSAEVSEALIETVIEVAELQMEKHIDFFAKIPALTEAQEAWEAMKHLAPRNLTLKFDYNYDSDSE